MTTATPPAPRAVQPYLFFEGRCEEAIEFYKSAIGAEVLQLMRFSDNPDPQPGMIPPGAENKIMHACIRVRGAQIMMSDGMCGGNAKFGGVSLALSVERPEDAEAAFAALSEGGQVQMPLGPTFFSPKFGMTADKFGVGWIIVTHEQGVAT